VRRIGGLVWSFWAVIFGMLFALVFITKFSVITHPQTFREWEELVFAILFAVGCVACVKSARRAFTQVDRRVRSN
jgi:hypothetical protein